MKHKMKYRTWFNLLKNFLRLNSQNFNKLREREREEKKGRECAHDNDDDAKR